MAVHLACGLVVAADCPLPELPLATDASPRIDVHVSQGAVAPGDGAPSHLPFLRVLADGALLVGEAGDSHFLVAPTAVTADPCGRRDWQRFFVGPVLGALCYLNGRLPLHASAVQVGDRTVAIAGPSGAGKSTLAATLALRHGHRLISDEISSLDMRSSPRRIAPYLPWHRLSPASAGLLGLDAADARPAASGDDDKLLFPARRFDPAPRRLDALYFLEASEEATRHALLPMPKNEALARLIGDLYRADIGEFCVSRQAMFAMAARVIGEVATRRLIRAGRAADPLSLARLIEADTLR